MPLRVGLLAYAGCFATEVFGVADLLVMADAIHARTGGTERQFRTTVLGTAARVRAAGGHELRAEAFGEPVDVLVVPGFEVHASAELATVLDGLAPEIDAIERLTRAGASAVAVCVGAFLLGEAGLLAGRRATTSWLFSDELQVRNPDCTVQADSMIVTDGEVTTTAAFSAAHDLALHLVRARCGGALARSLARVALVADNRSSQAPYVDERLLERNAGRLVRAARRWLVEHMDEPYDLGRLSDAFHVSSRTMLRHFAREGEATPLTYLQSARIEAAKRLLESPSETVSSAMTRVGYRDPTSFRRLFVRHAGITPGAYKQGFQRSRRAPST